MIKLENSEFKVKEWKEARADICCPENDKEFYSKQECNDMMEKMYMSIYKTLQYVFETAMRRDDEIINAVNDYIEHHNEGHLPELEKNQSKAILDAAGILNEFEDIKTPLDTYPHRIYAAFKDLNIKVKDNGQS